MVQKPIAPGPCSSSSSRVRATTRSSAVSQSVSTRRPSRRTRDRVSRSGEALASQPYRSLGSSRPRLTRSSARPRTPTIRPSRTAMSSASPLECSTDAERTQRSTSCGATPSASRASTRTGQSPPRPYGVRLPHGSAIRSTRRPIVFPHRPAGALDAICRCRVPKPAPPNLDATARARVTGPSGVGRTTAHTADHRPGATPRHCPSRTPRTTPRTVTARTRIAGLGRSPEPMAGAGALGPGPGLSGPSPAVPGAALPVRTTAGSPARRPSPAAA